MAAQKKNLLLSSICVLIGLVVLLVNLPKMTAYLETEKVDAVVSRCDYRRTTGNSDLKYKVYVDYRYGDRMYQDVFWKNKKSFSAKGNEVTIRVHPENPSSPVDYSPIIPLIVSVGFLLYGLRFFLPAVFKLLTRPRTVDPNEPWER